MQNENEELQLRIDFLESEIKAELASPAPNDVEETVKNVSRKPFVITEFEERRDREMAVFTHAKKLSEYIFVITEKSPKKLRWSIVARLQNTSVDVIENLYRANYERDEKQRTEFQKRAAVSLNLLDFFTETAKRKQAINMRQMAIIAKQISDIKRLLSGWVKSTKKS